MNARIPTLVIAVAGLAAVTLSACGDDDISADDWVAEVNEMCGDLGDERARVAADLDFGDGPPSVEQIQAFYGDFAPIWIAHGDKVAKLDRPDEIRDEIDALLATTTEYGEYMTAVAGDVQLAQVDMENDGQTDTAERMIGQATDLGLDVCVG